LKINKKKSAVYVYCGFGDDTDQYFMEQKQQLYFEAPRWRFSVSKKD
jgi:hypothetical protein